MQVHTTRAPCCDGQVEVPGKTKGAKPVDFKCESCGMGWDIVVRDLGKGSKGIEWHRNQSPPSEEFLEKRRAKALGARDALKENEMANKGKGKLNGKANGKARDERVTAASVVIALLGRASVPDDEDIISAVHDQVEKTKFDKKHLAWYKTQYKSGRWHDGKRQTIAQKDQPRAAKSEKPAKKAKKAKGGKKKVVRRAPASAETEASA